LPPYVDEIAELNVSHVTVTVNAVDPKEGQKIYSWVRYDKRVRRPDEGAEILLARQLQAIKALKERGVTVKVNTIIMPGINDHHVLDVAKKMAELGVDILNCMSYYPTPGSAFEDLKPPHPKLVFEIRHEAGKFIPQMHHCTRCRADAVGLLGEGPNKRLMQKLKEAATLPRNPGKVPRPSKQRPYIAATSFEGVLVNQHLGEADHLFIYGQNDGSIDLIEIRPTPPSGGGNKRWEAMTDTIDDCQALLVGGVGNSPKPIFAKKNIHLLEVEGVIEEVAKAIYDGSSLNTWIKRDETVCGVGCSGTGGGCG